MFSKIKEVLKRQSTSVSGLKSLSILSDSEIRALCEDTDTPMISPYNPTLVRKVEDRKVISFGSSSYGYDISSGSGFKMVDERSGLTIDPKVPDERVFSEHDTDRLLVPPGAFFLAHTKEYFRMPKDVTALVFNKSTYARVGMMCFPTVIEAGWEGEIVLEYANLTRLPSYFYAGEGCAQLLFFRGSPCDVPYDATRKYQGQRGITLAKV